MTIPTFDILDRETLEAIVDEAYTMLEKMGLFIENEDAFKLLCDAGQKAEPDTSGKIGRIYFSRDLIDRCVKSAPSTINLYDRDGNLETTMGQGQICFDPGSTALTFLEPDTGEIRPPVTRDYVRYARLMNHMKNIRAQSTAMICTDVPNDIQDIYRLFLSLLYCTKPVVTGTFAKENFAIMKEMLVAVRGSEDALREKPLAIFDTCPSPPLKWSDLTCQAVVDAARAGIPSEMVSMPMAGANAPITLSGSLVMHTAETLSGVVISQLACEGAPVIYGGSPLVMDMRAGTTPMGSIGTMMIDSAYAQIGRHFGIPTHAYMGLSDAKTLDAQCGFETGMGAMLAALSRIDMISGLGMLDFESCFSLEKLVLDNEMAGMTLRLLEGIQVRERPMAMDILKAYEKTKEVLSHPSTLKWYRKEDYIPSKIIERGVTQAWIKEGRTTVNDRARVHVEKLLAKPDPNPIDDGVRGMLVGIMERECSRVRCGMPKIE